MIEPERIRPLHEAKPVAGDYVLYWMQASQRTRHNPALELAVHRANEFGQSENGGAGGIRRDLKAVKLGTNTAPPAG